MITREEFSKVFDRMVVYASNPRDASDIASPSEEQQSQGVAPLDTLPAQWWNWFLQECTVRFNGDNALVGNMVSEVENLLSVCGLTADGQSVTQLKEMFEKDYPAKVVEPVREELDEKITELESKVNDTIETELEQVRQDADDLGERVGKIEEKIPEQASASNQLADKNFVLRHVATNTANFRGEWDNWQAVPSDAAGYPEDYTGSTTPTENDYMVVRDTSDYDPSDTSTVVGERKTVSIQTGGSLFDPYTTYGSVMTEEGVSKITVWGSSILSKTFRYYVDSFSDQSELKSIRVSSTSRADIELDPSTAHTIVLMIEPANWSTTLNSLYYQETTLNVPYFKGAWQFKYTGDWASKGKDGWEPEFALGDTVDLEMLDERYQTLDKAAEQDKRIDELELSRPMLSHNIPRLIPKDITSYVQDGTLWARLNGTRGTDETSGVPGADKYYPCEDIYVGDYWKMSRPISAYERTGTYQMTGSEWVTIAGIDMMWGNGETGNANTVLYHHLVMVPGKGFAGKQHFGRSRMNNGNTTAGGYKASEMNTVTIGAVATAGATGAQATINQQLYAEFGARLKTTRELVSNAVNNSGYNRYGSATGCSSGLEWVNAQAILMSEIEVYGSVVWSSSGYDTGNARVQLPLFAFSKKAQNIHGPDASGENVYWWLKDVASSSEFGYAHIGGAYAYGAGWADGYVRPRFVLGA